MRSGDQLDRYVLVDELPPRDSDGTRTWRGRDVILDRDVLLRCVPSSQSRAAALIDAAQAAAGVDHQNLARVLDVVLVPPSADQPESVAAVMEWVAGTTIEDALESGQRLGLYGAVAMVEALSSALEQAHLLGVCHGRVRTSAVIIDEGGDFCLRGLAVDAAVLGPIRTDLAAALSDIDGVGRIAYEILTGQIPEDVTVPPSWVRPDVPNWLDEVVLGCLACPGGRPRFTSMAQVRMRLPGRVARFPRRRRALALSDWARRLVASAFAAAVVAGLFVVGMALVRHGSATAAVDSSVSSDAQLLREPVSSASPASSPATTQRDVRPTVYAYAPDQAVGDAPATDPIAGRGVEPVDAVVDSDISTCWKSRTYKLPVIPDSQGVGLLADLGSVQSVSAVDVTFGENGSDVDVRVGESLNVDPRTWPMLTQAQQGDPVIRLRGAEPLRGRYVLLWFPRLPAKAAHPERYQVHVCEIGITTETG